MRRRLPITLAFVLAALLIAALPRTAAAAPAPGPTSATGPISAPGPSSVCSLGGLVPARGSNCPATGRLRRLGWGLPSLLNPVHVVKKVAGGVASTAIRKVALAAILGWVASGAESALKETAKVIDHTTSPQLTSGWFSASYWRIAGIAALLTIPFLCTAAIHALVRSDLGLLARAAFGYLPLSLLAVGIASQLTMLLLAGADEMSSIVASASAHADSVFLSTTSVGAIAESVATQDPFVTFLAAIVTVAATLALWLELLVRDAAVYVIVLMLPMFFAAMVWPARRTLAIRAIETLIALILSKFAIVAVLSLGGSALGHSTIPGAASVLTGGTLVLLAAFTPWALLRMLPLHEVASAAAGGLSQAPKQTLSTAADTALKLADGAAALGAERFGRRALPEGESWMLGGGSRTPRQSAADANPELGAEHGSEPVDRDVAEAVDADVAEPVTSAMSGAPGSGDALGSATATVPGSATDVVPGSERAVGQTGGDAARSATDQPDAAAGSTLRWPEMLAFPDTAGGDDPELLVGDDLRELADEQRLPPAGADDDGQDPASTGAAEPSSPAPERPIPPPRDAIGPPRGAIGPPRGAIGPPPGDPRRSGAPSEADEPSRPRVAPAPDLGFDPLAGGNV
jgi:hypothetical protein